MESLWLYLTVTILGSLTPMELEESELTRETSEFTQDTTSQQSGGTRAQQ